MSPTMNSAPTAIAVLRCFSLVMTASMIPSHMPARGAPPRRSAGMVFLVEEATRPRRRGRRPGGVDRVVRRGHLRRAAVPRKGRGGLPLRVEGERANRDVLPSGGIDGDP